MFLGTNCEVNCCDKYKPCKVFSKTKHCADNYPCPTSCEKGYYREFDPRTKKIGTCKQYRKPCGINQYRNSKYEGCRDINTRELVESFSDNLQYSNNRLLEYVLLIIMFYLFYRFTKLATTK
mgnify:CR=1 FL=1